jgi:hypothetical protein
MENKVVPNEIITLITAELKKYSLDIKDIDYDLCKRILKKIKKPQYYKHIHSIISQCKNEKLEVTDDFIIKICTIFDHIQSSYEKYKTKNKHFLTYKYTIYKIFELLGYTDFLYIFPKPILQNRDIIHEHDMCWKLICQEKGFPFYSTLDFYE